MPRECLIGEGLDAEGMKTSTHNEIVAPGSPKQHDHWGGRVEQVDVKDSLALLWRV